MCTPIHENILSPELWIGRSGFDSRYTLQCAGLLMVRYGKPEPTC